MFTVKDLFTFEGEDELYYFANDEMMKKGFLIQLSTLNLSEICVYRFKFNETHTDIVDVVNYTMYWEKYSSPIELYILIKEIYQLFLDTNVESFIIQLETLSTSLYSASMQTEVKIKEETLEEGRRIYHLVKTLMTMN